MEPKIGIMQGRLSNQIGKSIQYFPELTWKEEFQKAHELGFNSIEWIFDQNKNPLSSPDGISEILNIQKQSGIKINSICADYFMEKKLFNESETDLLENIKILKNLIEISTKLEISMIEIPLVDSSSLQTIQEKKQLKQNLEKILSDAENHHVDIILETDLSPNNFKDYLDEINHPRLFANYDSGNSASLGYNPNDELQILKKWIKNVHIKDRKLSGSTVPLGMGDTDFESVFSNLKQIDYSGDLIIQGSRIPEKKRTTHETCLSYLRFVDGYLNKYYR